MVKFLQKLANLFANFCRKCFKNSNIVSGGRCSDHNFLRFLTIVGEKIGVFCQNQCYDHNFAEFGFVLCQKRHFLLNFSAKMFQKF
jgi:hypothetical protein